MATVAEQIQQIYIGLLGRAADQVGATYWETQINSGNLTLDQMRANIVNDQAEYAAGLGSMTRTGAITELYSRMFERVADATDIAYWATGDGSAVPIDTLSLTFMTAALGADVTTLANKTAAAVAYTSAAGTNYTAASALTAIDSVDSTQASLDASLAATAAAFPSGATFSLTSGTDRGADFNGGTGNDHYDAFLAQNSFSGGVSNSLSSADVLNGGGGADSLFAELVPEFFGATGDNQIDVQPRTSNIETVQFEARDTGGNNTTNTKVTVDAKNMLDVDKIGSYMSDGDLVIENLTTQQTSGGDRNTDELTITMDHTDNFNSDNDASDLTVYFDEDYLLVGKSTTTSQANYWILDEDSADYVGAPLLNIERNGVTLTIDGVAYEIKMADAVASTKDTWVSFAAGLQDVITASGEAAFAGLTVAVDLNNTDSTYNDAGVQVTIPAITITDAAGRALVPTGFTSPEETTAGFDIYGRFDNVASTSVDNPLAINVELNKVGREGEGGDLLIGGKELDQDGGAQSQGNGIGIFNIDVLGDSSKLSNLGSINSTNGALTTVNIKTGAAFVSGATHASLTVRDAFDASAAMKTVNANAFLGDLNIGQDVAALNVNTFTATGGGDVTYNANISGTEKSVFTNTTGEGSDKITVALDGDAVDTVGTSFAVSSNGGNDSITVSMTTGDVSVGTTNSLNNLSINAGTGDDKVLLKGGSTGATDGDADFNINAGAGSDFVHTTTVGDPGSVNSATVTYGGSSLANFSETITILDAGGTSTLVVSFVNGNAATTATIGAVSSVSSTATYTAVVNAGVVTITSSDSALAFTATSTNPSSTTSGITVPAASTAVPAASNGSWTVGTSTGASAASLLYKAELTVNFAGFEETVTVVTTAANGFVASQVDINNAIKAAIAADADLARLLTTKAGTGTQQMTIQSTVEGDNDLVIEIVQPVVVTTGATAVQVTLVAADVTPLLTGALATGLGGVTSSTAAGALATAVGNATTTVVATGVTTDGTDETNVTNVSVIDMGAGANDLVALNSHDASIQTLDFTAAWGKVAVVNFFDGQASSTVANQTEGDHILDFTNWLDDKIDSSVGNGNGLSEARSVSGATVGVTAASITLESNHVTTVNDFAQAGTETWANLGAANLQAALNGTVAATDYSNIVSTSLQNVAAPTNLVGTSVDSILMVENDLNAGEYKVFNVEVSDLGASDAAVVTLLGVIDFGSETVLADGNVA